jgi:predicted aldo/keto reductase-like oxidoreductase
MQRRDVLRGAAGLAAWAAMSTSRSCADEPSPAAAVGGAGKVEGHPTEVRKGDMLYRALGTTGEKVSAIGLGGYHIGLIRSESESTKLIRTAIDRGITFMDNCWDYHGGKSEEWMGKALGDGYRAKVFLMTKIDGRTREAAARQIDESLKRLATDHIDLMQIHENIRMEDADRCFSDGGAIEALETAKKAGKIRHIGFTGHKDPLVHLRMLDVAAQHQYKFAACQMPLNVLDAKFRSFAQVVVPRLIKEGVAVLGMKSMANAAIVKGKVATPKECLTYALSLPTSVVISGMDSMKVLEENLDTVKNFKPIAANELDALLARVAPQAESGKFERFKTAADYDGTAHHPEWLG